MLCQECQVRSATLRFMKIQNGEKTEYHLCEACAREKGEGLPGSPNAFSIHNLLSGLLSPDSAGSAAPGFRAVPDLHCPQCGMSYSQFSKTGRFGCSTCYRAFGSQIEPVFRRVQGNTAHAGKIPKRAGKLIQSRRELDLLKKELSRLIENEEFEHAAQIRDRIRSCERVVEEREERQEGI